MSEMARPTIAFCGAGMIAAVHAACADELGLRVVAVASRTRERAARLAEPFRAAAVDYVDLAGAVDYVDLAVVATPPERHAPDVLALLAAGATVLVEKPLCRTLAEADALVQAAERHHGRLLYGENLAYAPLVQQVVQMAPTLGDLTHVEVRALQGLPTWGAFTTDEWGGGALFDLGIHPLAVAMLVANAAGHGRPRAVSADLRGGVGHDSDEHAEVRLHYADGPAVQVVASWQWDADPLWDMQVAGTRGVVRAELLPAPALEHNGEQLSVRRAQARVATLGDLGYIDQLRDLVAVWRTAAEPLMTAAFGSEVLQVAIAAYASAGRDGVQVALPYKGPRDLTALQTWRRS
jgi:predicted dehydrogenase